MLLLSLVHRENEPSFLHPTLPPLLPLGTYLKFFLSLAQAPWSPRWADCNFVILVSMKTEVMTLVSWQAVPRTTLTIQNTLLVPITHSPLWCSAREESGGQTLNIAVFKVYNNIFFASPPTICWAVISLFFFFLFFRFFSWAHVFSQFRQNHYFYTQLSWLHEQESDCIIHLRCS